MATPISADLRLRIFHALQDGETTTEVAERFDVSSAFVRRLHQRERETGSLAPKTGPRGRPPILNDRVDDIRKILADRPDPTAGEVRRKLGVDVCVNTVWRAIRRLGLTFKKKSPRRRTRA